MGRHLPDRGRPGRARGARLPRRLPPRRVPPDAGGEPVHVETTRPELIPSVVALIAHPDDERYAGLFGSTVRSPLFGVEVPVVAHPAAEMDKGAGIAMCCTFGDLTDVIWWRELQLPTRSVITRQGRIQAEVPEWIAGGPGAELFAELAGKTVHSAREARRRRPARVRRPRRRAQGDPAQGQLLRARREAARDRHVAPVVHPQRRSRRRPQRQARRPGPVHRLPPVVHAGALLQLGRRAQRRLARLSTALLRRRDPRLVPPRRRGRARVGPADRPVRGRAPDRPRHRRPRRATTSRSAGRPMAFRRPRRPRHLGDVVTVAADRRRVAPVDESGEVTTDPVFDKVFPMDVRPQGHDIIRTWLFATVVRAYYEHGTVPWRTPRSAAGSSTPTARR